MVRQVRTSDARLTGWRRVVERLYRLTHHGQIRTLVLSRDQIAAREWLETSGVDPQIIARMALNVALSKANDCTICDL